MFGMTKGFLNINRPFLMEDDPAIYMDTGGM